MKKNGKEILGLKNTMAEWKNSIESFNSTLDQAEESVNSETDNLKLPSKQSKKKKECIGMKKVLQGLRDTIKRNNSDITGVPGEKRKKEAESLFKEIMAENFPNLGRYLDIQVYKADMSLPNFNPKPSSLRHSIIKLSKVRDKEKILKSSREKNFFHAREPPLDYQWISQPKPCRSGKNGMIYSKC